MGKAPGPCWRGSLMQGQRQEHTIPIWTFESPYKGTVLNAETVLCSLLGAGKPLSLEVQPITCHTSTLPFWRIFMVVSA